MSSTFLTALPDGISVEPNEEEEQGGAVCGFSRSGGMFWVACQATCGARTPPTTAPLPQTAPPCALYSRSQAASRVCLVLNVAQSMSPCAMPATSDHSALAALVQLRKVVRLLDKENEQFKRDCENKMNFQRRQEQHLREDNEQLRMKVNDLSRPKVSALAVLEEKQHQLVLQLESYTAKTNFEQWQLDEINKKIEANSARTADLLSRIRAAKEVEKKEDSVLFEQGFTLVRECPSKCKGGQDDPPPGQPPQNTDKNKCNVCLKSFRSVWVDKKGGRYTSKGDVERSLAYVPDVKLKKKLVILEGRVNKTLIKFNEALVVNKELRAEIDHLRQERMQFDSIQARLEGKLNQRKAEIVNAIEATNVALETRDEANKKIASCKREIAADQQEFDAAWRELDNDMDSEEKRRRQVKARMMEEDLAKKTSTNEDSAQKKQLQELTAKYEESKADVQRFEEAFAQLQEATGLKDVDELVSTFLEAEEQNFKLFNFLNELNQEQDRLANETNEIKAEAERASLMDHNPRKKEIETKLEDQLAQMQARTEELSEMEEEESSKVREILKIIRRVYEELGCHKLVTTVDSFQWESDGEGKPVITDSNMLHFLGIIEQRARVLMNRLISEQAVATDDEVRGDLTLTCLCPLGKGPTAPVGASKLRVDAPKIDTDDKSGDENDDDEDDDSIPMSQEQIRARMKKKIAATRDSKGGAPADLRRKNSSAQRVLQKKQNAA